MVGIFVGNAMVGVGVGSAEAGDFGLSVGSGSVMDGPVDVSGELVFIAAGVQPTRSVRIRIDNIK
jgi:hypothetical protein